MAKQVKNEFKNKEQPKKQKKAEPSSWTSFSFTKDDRYVRVLGLVFIGFAVFSLLAFTSFLFSWQTDQSLVKGLQWNDFQEANPQMANNWMGVLGAFIAHFLIYRWFGVAAYLFSLLSFIIGYRLLFKVNLLPLRKSIVATLFFIFWLSITLGFFATGQVDYLGGGFGYEAQLWLAGLIGSAGTIIFLLITLLIFLTLTFNLSFYLPDNLKNVVRKLNPKHWLIPDQTEEFEEVAPDLAEHQPEETAQSNDSTNDQPIEQKPEEDSHNEPSATEPLDETPTEADPLTDGIELKVTNEEEEQGQEPESKTEEGEEEGPSLEIETPKDETEEASEKARMTHKAYDPTLDLSNYHFPGLDLLNDYNDGQKGINQEELEERKNLIVNTLKNYKIEIDKIKATVGPTVTLYEIVPAAGVRIAKIKNLEDDIALSLAALGIRIIAPIPGLGTIGIEVPNSQPELVSIKSVFASQKFRESDYELPIAIGKTISNEVYVTDLSKMPHLLMAGATGQGKSVGLNVVIASLLYKKHPSQVKFVLVDPKKVELSLFRKIENHFLAKLPDNEEAIITDTSEVVTTLNSLCAEMDERYDLLKDAQVRNVAEYNKKFMERKLNPENGHRFLPYIVLVIDELADLMMTAGKEIESPVARLAQLARAIGIHLILATQRPSVNIITGVIKANFPARIAYRVTSKVDSRTILDSGGAEQLIGKGDMLFCPGGDIVRLQSPFIDTDEVEGITDYIGQQQAYSAPTQLPEVKSEEGDSKSPDDALDNLDSLFDEAARLIVQHQQGSTSLIQRRLKLGYNRAGRIVDQLEAMGIVGPNEGSKAREVMISDEYALEQFLTEMRQNKDAKE